MFTFVINTISMPHSEHTRSNNSIVGLLSNGVIAGMCLINQANSIE